jgi:hypothetical protein
MFGFILFLEVRSEKGGGHFTGFTPWGLEPLLSQNSLLDLGDNDESTDRRVEWPLVSSSFYPAAVE